jgi:S-adenosylmethionine decarboxylase
MEKKEFCGTNGYLKYAGIHLLVEVWHSSHLTSLPRLEKMLRKCVESCEATLLNIDLHEFSPNGGISGVAILQESHISIHTWPEYKYAAMDIFVCGTVDPYKAIPVIKSSLTPQHIQISEIKRGIF